jgi:ubiquinone/menaquinone biosynthesis C-methylase UbiE
MLPFVKESNNMNVEEKVSQYYTARRTLEELLEQVYATSADRNNPTVDDLAPYDDMHIGGRKAVFHLMEYLEPAGGDRILDVGSGIGGPSRLIAEKSGAHITGVDLTPSYQNISRSLSSIVGLDDLTEYIVASAAQLPFDNQCFDKAYMIHVGMNLNNKSKVYESINRVLRNGGLFCLYDIMSDDSSRLEYPLPWAQTGETSFVESCDQVCKKLEEAGFDIMEIESRKTFALESLKRAVSMQQKKNEEQEVFAGKLQNLLTCVEQNICFPYVLVCRKTVS